jgi:hypothetical protein
MKNRITKYSWHDAHGRVDQAREILSFCSAIIRIHKESGEHDGTEIHVMRLTHAAAAEVLHQESPPEASS